MPTRRYTDWKTWWYGLRTNLMKCAGNTGAVFLTTNGAASLKIPILENIGMNWKTALWAFVIHLGKEAFDYMRTNQPQVITETVETSVVTTTTVTPVPNENKPNQT